MTDLEYERLRKFIIISWLILLAVIVGLAFWGSYEIRTLNQTIAVKEAQLKGEIPYIKDGVQGKQGDSGLSGNNGNNGANGQNGQSGPQGTQGTTGLQGPVGPKGDTGATGPQGPQGPSGKVIYERTNPVTQQQECRYAGDSDWQPASECQ